MDEIFDEMNGKAKIKGMLTGIKQIDPSTGERYYEHTLTEPAKDEYSHPKSYPVCSNSILGAKGTVFEVLAEIRSWKSKGFHNIRLWAVEGV